MRKVHLLLGCSDRSLNRNLEALSRDVFYNHAVVEMRTTSWLEEFARLACYDGFDLILVSPDHLLSDPARHSERDTWREMIGLLGAMRGQSATPFFVVGVPHEFRTALVEAGADAVLGWPFHNDTLKEEIRRVLNLKEEATAETASSRWSLSEWLTRAFG
jgi:hypothetical protein